LLALTMLLLLWAPKGALMDRFALARAVVVDLYPSRRRPGESYCGFMKCLLRHSTRLLAIISDALRQRLIERAAGVFKTAGFVVFGVDGTKIELPRTDRNLQAFGNANKEHAAPQALLVGIFHLATHTLWSFRHDKAGGCERGLLQQMIGDLPSNSLIVGDAGFVGYSVMRALLQANVQFVIRAGANVRLLKKLGYVREHKGTVYLWPNKQQKRLQPPIVLRLLRIHNAKGQEMCLLTSVRDAKQLSDEMLCRLYTMRWGVEIAYRWLKCLLSGRKMLSTSPEHAAVELQWTVMGLWMLSLMAQPQPLQNPSRLSLAKALRAVRRALLQHRQRGRSPVPLATLLLQARTDRYRRKRPKSKRHWPSRARVHRCKMPLARMASQQQIQRIQGLLANIK